KILEAALANEADAGAVLLGMGDEIVGLGDAAHLGLVQFTHRNQRASEGLFVHGVEEIALVLVVVDTFQQTGLAAVVPAAHIMTGGDQFRAKDFSVFQKHFELDFPVAEDIGVGGASGAVFSEEVGEHVVPVFGGEVGGVQLDTEPSAD